jgi:hypothetical protein
MQKTKRIPTLLALILLVITVGGIGFLFEGITRQSTIASLSIEPKSVMVTNLTDTSFTFTWQTEELASGTLLATSVAGKKYSAFDERDITGKMGKYLTHAITVRTLTPSTSYDVTVLSNGKKYPVETKSFQVTTLPTLSNDSPLLDPAFGSIQTASNLPAEGALVYLNLEGSQTLSTLVRTSGSWIIPLSLIRTQDGAAYIISQDRINETLVVQLGTSESRVTTDTLNDAPVPDIILGQPYDFRGRDAKKTTPATLAQKQTTPTINPKQVVLGATTDKTISGIALTAPVQGATISSNKPLITGIGIAGKTVTITIGITDPTIGSTIVGKDGVWRYTPKQALNPGKQSVTVTTVDAKNKPVAITHTFTVLKSGSQVLGDATPSGTIEATPSATITPSPTSVATESATPTATLSGEEMPTSGSFLPTLLLIVLGCTLFLGGGAVLLIK